MIPFSQQITREFKRLSGRNLADFNAGVKKYSDRLSSLKSPKGKLPEIATECKAMLQASETETAKKR